MMDRVAARLADAVRDLGDVQDLVVVTLGQMPEVFMLGERTGRAARDELPSAPGAALWRALSTALWVTAHTPAQARVAPGDLRWHAR